MNKIFSFLLMFMSTLLLQPQSSSAEVSGNYYATNAGAMRIGNATDTCVMGITGATRYNAGKQTLEVCIGATWIGIAGWLLNDMYGSGIDTAIVNYTSNYNMFLGVGSGASYSSGSYNTGVGHSALAFLTNASENTSLGGENLYSLNSGNGNTCIGSLAGYSITSGSHNICIGVTTMYNTFSTGSRNIAIGTGVMAAPASAAINDSIFIGSFAANSWGALSGSPNTGVGSHVFRNLTSGNENTAFGAQGVMQNISAAQYNTSFGFYSMMENLDTECCNTAFGTGSLRMVNGTSNLAIGGGDYWGGTLFNTSGYSNVAVGNRAAASVSSGYENTFAGAQAGDTVTTGAMGVYVGYDSDANANNYNNAVALGYQANVLASNKIRVANGSVTLVSGQVGFTTYSDRREKENIQKSDLGLDFVLGLRPVSYRMIEGNERLDYGFIAQDIEKLLGERKTNMISIAEDDEGTYSLRSSDLLSPIVKAIQEQNKTIERQKLKLQEQKLEIQKLKATIHNEE